MGHARSRGHACSRACGSGCEAGLGLLTEGLTVPRDLGDRSRALKQLQVELAAHSRMVAMV
ncbi:hypothetical protein [Streptomyces erythrochromogenes]|uniref:hypothetical protein n=1 Tax=Streptomyces erythrochromogenes TaxID=285574 RepID=UPI0036C85559